ncbi:MAG: DUF1697 domain-containing protein [Clostridium sp.]
MKEEITVAFLRGINVGGKNRIIMKELKEALEAENYIDVKTYIQSGNILFNNNNEDNAKKIAEIIEDKFGLAIKVITRSINEIKDILDNNPYGEESYITFLEEKPQQDDLGMLNEIDGKGDSFKVREKNIYVLVNGGYHKTKYSNDLFEKKLKCAATTRNVKVLRKIITIK